MPIAMKILRNEDVIVAFEYRTLTLHWPVPIIRPFSKSLPKGKEM